MISRTLWIIVFSNFELSVLAVGAQSMREGDPHDQYFEAFI